MGGGASFDRIGAKPAKSGMLFGAELAFLNKGNTTVGLAGDTVALAEQYGNIQVYEGVDQSQTIDEDIILVPVMGKS